MISQFFVVFIISSMLRSCSLRIQLIMYSGCLFTILLLLLLIGRPGSGGGGAEAYGGGSSSYWPYGT